MEKYIIRVENLRRDFVVGGETVHALRGVSFSIREGEFVTIMGTSGSGKSTLLNLLGCLDTATAGEYYLDGISVREMSRNDRATLRNRKIGFVFQSYNLLPKTTALENVELPLFYNPSVSARDRKERSINALHEVGLADRIHHRSNQMSGGQQQRIAIARSLLLKPSLLLLDEPFSALDAKIRQQMREELKKIQSDLGITVVFVTHDQEEAMSLSHRIVVMNKGKFEQIGTPTEIYDRPATRHVASFIGEMNFIDKGDKTIAVRPEDVTVSLDGSGDFTGTVRTIMVLGHYVVVNVQHGENVIKCFVDRDISEKLSVGQSVGMHIGKHTVFDK